MKIAHKFNIDDVVTITPSKKIHGGFSITDYDDLVGCTASIVKQKLHYIMKKGSIYRVKFIDVNPMSDWWFQDEHFVLAGKVKGRRVVKKAAVVNPFAVGERVEVIREAPGLKLGAITNVTVIRDKSVTVALNNRKWSFDRFKSSPDTCTPHNQLHWLFEGSGKKILQEVREELRVKVGNDMGTCSWAELSLIGKDRISKSFHIQARCHADHMYQEKVYQAVVCDIGGVNYTQAQMEVYKKYMTFMLNESPWAKFYLTKDYDEAMKLGVVMDLNVPHDYFVSACVALREAHEFSQETWEFGEWLKKGVSTKAAWFLCHYVSGATAGKLKCVNQHGGHRAHSGLFNSGALFSFLNRGLNGKCKSRITLGNTGKNYALCAQIQGDHNDSDEEKMVTHNWVKSFVEKPKDADAWGQNQFITDVKGFVAAVEGRILKGC